MTVGGEKRWRRAPTVMDDGATVQTGECRCGQSVSRSTPSMLAGLSFDWPFVCQECVGDEAARETAEEARRRTERAKARRAKRIEASGIPSALQDVTALDASQAQAVDGWPDRRLGVVLVGPIGVGKTHVAAVAAWRLLDTRPVRWTSAPLLFARLGTGFDSEHRQQAVELLTGDQALVLDDIDKSRPTEYGAEQVFLAVDGRVQAGVPLLVTTNLTLGELARKFPEPWGEAVASRLAGYCDVHRLEGPDRRLT